MHWINGQNKDVHITSVLTITMCDFTTGFFLYERNNIAMKHSMTYRSWSNLPKVANKMVVSKVGWEMGFLTKFKHRWEGAAMNNATNKP